MAVGVLVLLAGVITAGVVAGSSSGAPTAVPSSAPAASTAPTTSAPYTVFPTQPAAPSAKGWTVQTMFGTYNTNCRTLTPITGEIAAITCKTTDKINTDFAQYSGSYDQYTSTVRSGFDTFTFITEDACSADYRAALTTKEGVQYQHYVRIYKNSPFTWSEVSAVDQATWDEMVNAPLPRVGDTSVLCGGQ